MLRVGNKAKAPRCQNSAIFSFFHRMSQYRCRDETYGVDAAHSCLLDSDAVGVVRAVNCRERMVIMPYFKTQDGCSLYYELIGDGPGKRTIAFVNGTLQTTVYWKLVSKGVSNRYRLLLYDGRGQGESDLGQVPLSLKQHAGDLTDLLDALDIQKATLIGISHGARVALALADERPELVARMVLCSVSTQSSFRAKMIIRSWHEILQRHSLDAMVWAAVPHVFGRIYLHESEKILDRIVKTIVRRNHTEALRAHLNAMHQYAPLAGMLKKHPFLVMVLTGEDDPLVTREGGQEVAAICGGRHVELKGIGHSIPAEAPELFVRLVLDFLSTKQRDIQAH
jgi:3-oxoadipate enol-lactonase